MSLRHLKLLVTTDIDKLEHDPKAQYTFNLWALWIWLVQMPVVLILLIFFDHFWIQISVVYIAEASVWALVATHFGAMSAALAAKHQDKGK